MGKYYESFEIDTMLETRNERIAALEADRAAWRQEWGKCDVALGKVQADLAAARTAAHAWKRAAKFWYFAQPDDDGEWERWQEYRYRRELFKPVTLED